MQYTDPTGMEPEGDCCPGVKKVVDRYIDRNVGILTGAASEAWNAAKFGIREAILPGSFLRDGINLARNHDKIIPGIKSSLEEGYRIMSEGTDHEQGQLTGRIGFMIGVSLVGGEGALLSRAPSMAGRGLSLGGNAAKGVNIASSAGGKTLPMTVERILPQGSKITDIVNDVKGMTWMTGNEHAVVRLANGQKAIVSGGPGGISFQSGQIRTLFGHTHPTSAPPSLADFNALRILGQSKQYVIHGGQTTLIRP